MVFKFKNKKLKNIKIFKSNSFRDKRGYIWTSWKNNKKSKIFFNHDKFSLSKKNVFRGLHYDNKTWKLVSCVYGKVFLVLVNCDKKSSEYLRIYTVYLSQNRNIQILIPPKFANGHLCLSSECLFHYKLSYKGKYSDIDKQKNLKWNDSRLSIKWPKKNFIMSKRDS
jgi:dTDP-4-dehydrorhamnose 3,5-epimerase